MIAVTLVVIVGIIGFFVVRTASAGPVTQGVESMPPKVRAAFMNHGSNPAAPPPKTP